MDRLIEEAKRLEALCLLAAERHYAAASSWFRLKYVIGIPCSALALTAGIAAFGQFEHSNQLVAITALMAALLAALMTMLDPSNGHDAHHTTGKRYEGVYHAAGFFWRFEVAKSESNARDLEQTLLSIRRKFEELTESSPAIPGKAFRRIARRGHGAVLRVTDESLVDSVENRAFVHRMDAGAKVVRRG